MGIKCALAGLLIALLYGLLIDQFADPALTVAAPAAAFLTGAAFWRLLRPATGGMSKRRGAFAGGLTGAIAHIPFWVLIMLISTLCPPQGGSCGLPADGWSAFFDGLPAVLLLALASLIVVGWLTIPVGALIGAAQARSQRQTAIGKAK